MTKFKSVCCLILFSILILFPSKSFANELPTELIFYNDKLLELNYAPIVQDSIIYAQLREISSILGLEVTYDALSQEATVTNTTDIFIYNLTTGHISFNNTPIIFEESPFMLNDFTWVPVETFCKLFGFSARYNSELLISQYLGEEILELDYLPEPIYFPVYNDIPVTSIFINDSIPTSTYTNGNYSVCIKTAFMENDTLKITFIPFTEVPYPDGYTLMSDPRLLNFSLDTINLPIAPLVSYTYLTYEPDAFSNATTTNVHTLLKDILEAQLYLADITVSNGHITSIEQIYIP